MEERHNLRCAVYLILIKVENNEKYILLQRRYNTGLYDGMWDLAVSGHLEKGESLSQGIIRESKEEIGIELTKIEFSSVMNAKFGNLEYIFQSFIAQEWTGNIEIKEKDKVDKLEWFKINDLPENIIDTRRIMIENYINGNKYSEYGF